MLSYSDFSRAKAIPKSGPHRVYGVLGDAYLQQGVIAAILEASLDADARDFNMDTLDGESATVVDVLARGSNLPFLSERRAIVVSRAERLESIGRSSESEGDAPVKEKSKAAKGASPAARLTSGLENLPTTTVLILARTPETPEPGARSGTARCINANVDKVIDKLGVIIDCTIGPRHGNLASSVVLQEAARRNIPLQGDAAAHLTARVGSDIALLLSELEKCALRAGIGNVVTSSVIDEMTRRAPQETIFDLTDALGERRGPRALGLLRELLQSGEPPELILTMLVRHLRQLLQARAFLDARLPLDASLARRLPPSLEAQLPRDGRDNLANLLVSQAWMGRRLGNQARNFSTPQLEAALQDALAVDLAMKGIEGDGGPPELLLDLLITRLVSGL